MTTEVILTGTGVPIPVPGRAGGVRPFSASSTPEVVWTSDDGTVRVLAVAVHVVLTHLIPPPAQPGDTEAFAQDLRDGGYTGTITVGEDLTAVTLDRSAPQGEDHVR